MLWKSLWNTKPEDWAKSVQEYKEQGYRVHDLEVYDQRGQVRLAGYFHKNDNNMGWHAAWRQDFKSFDKLYRKFRQNNYMMLIDIEVITERDSSGKQVLRYSGVWLENKNRTDQVVRWNIPGEKWLAESKEYRDKGYRPIDLEAYVFNGSIYTAAVWVKNTDGRDWYASMAKNNKDFTATFKEQLEKKKFKPIDIDSFVTDTGKRLFIGIWEPNPGNRNWKARWDRSFKEYDKFSEDFHKEGLMPADFYSYSYDGLTYYGGFWVEN